MENSEAIISDEQLWRQAIEGDESAEAELVKKYSKVVKACARPYFLIGGDSEDLNQEGMLGLISAIRHYDPERDASFRTYAELCIRNRLYSAIKNAARLKHTPLNDYVSFQSPHFDESKTFAAGYARNPEELLLIKERLNDIMDNKEGQLLKLYLDGQSYDEIAGKIGKSSKAVDNAVQRIRKKLAQLN